MRVLHVNSDDLHSRRFTGFDLLSELRSRGIEGKQVVLRKQSSEPDVVQILDTPIDMALQDAMIRAEQQCSMRNLLYPWGRVLESTPEFASADVVHYHLIHNQVISLFDLPRLFAAKPSVWTFHDPWPLTGHCIHPMACTGWLRGCRDCPALDVDFPMEQDCAHRMWAVKQRIFAQLDVDVVVASEFMLDMVRRSPLTAGFDRVHLIPFGIDTRAFLPDSEKAESRRRLGIPQDDFVCLFRSAPWEFKGLPYIIEALGSRPPTRPTTLLTVDKKGLVGSLSDAYNIVELGWVEDRELYPRVFSACDVLLMPSTAEAFGLMALEAMAAGRPVICFEGTSLPSVTAAPECGVAVPMCDATALRSAVDDLAADPGEALRRGQLGRRLARERYEHDRYLDAMAALYDNVSRRDWSAT